MSLLATLDLRPTRVGFLVRPKDRSSLRKIMRLNTCLWGGVYNPIIPVCRTLPVEWKQDRRTDPTGPKLSAGYLRFFEPDVYVEAEEGLADILGIEDPYSETGHPRVVKLSSLLQIDNTIEPYFVFGLDVSAIYEFLYQRQFQFVLRHEHRIALFEPLAKTDLFFEAAFGAFPEIDELNYIRALFCETFSPTQLEPNAENYLKVLIHGYQSLLDLTRYSLNERPGWSRGATLFILQPSNPLDLIDLWNLRLYRRHVVPINIHWFPKLVDFVAEFIERNHRPLPGNPHGVMIETLIQFSRTLSEEALRDVKDGIASTSSKGYVFQEYYDSIWREVRDDGVVGIRPMEVWDERKHLELTGLMGRDGYYQFQALSPQFAEVSLGARACWVNVLKIRNSGTRSDRATVWPSSLEDPHRSRIRRGQPVFSSRAGLVFPQTFKDSAELIELPSGRESVCAWFERKGIKAEVSEYGRIADQLVASVNGLLGARLFAHAPTLHLLDKMAKSVRSRTLLETEEEVGGGGSLEYIEEYPDRTSRAEEWESLLRQRSNDQRMLEVEIEDFVRAGALKLGLMIRCRNCENRNWYGLAQLDEQVVCDRCLDTFDFPQASLNYKNTPWHFRLAGPYSVPDYAGGAYATVLALRAFAALHIAGGASLTYSVNLDLQFDENRLEVDFAFWYQRGERFDRQDEPVFVIGEAKSFAKEAIRRDDVKRLKMLVRKLPGTIVVFTVLKEELSENEQDQVARFARWGRKRLENGRQRAPVVVLTATELLSEESIRLAWKMRGGKHEELMRPGMVHLDNLETLADLTQQLYLGMRGWREELMDRLRSRQAKEGT